MGKILLVMTQSGRIFLSTDDDVAKLVSDLPSFGEDLESVTEIVSGSEIVLEHRLRTYDKGEVDRTEEFLS